MNKKKLSERFREGLEKLKPMTWPQRIDHIWTYYKAVLLFAVAVVIIPIGLIISFAGKRDVIFGGMAINVDMRGHGTTYLSDDLFAHLGGDPAKETVDLSANVFDNYSTEIDANYNAAMSTIGRIEAGTLDYVIMDKVALEFYIIHEIYLDLNLVFTPEELSAFGEENVIKVVPENAQHISTPIAIDISDTVFAKDCLSPTEEIYFAFVGPAENAEEYRAFWDYFMAWEQTDYHKELAGK